MSVVDDCVWKGMFLPTLILASSFSVVRICGVCRILTSLSSLERLHQGGQVVELYARNIDRFGKYAE